MKHKDETKQGQVELNAVHRNRDTGEIEFYAYTIPEDLPVNMSPNFYTANL
jgi:hypothetical protein